MCRTARLSRKADDLSIQSRRSSRLFGRASRMRAKDFLLAGPAAMTGSQPSDMVVSYSYRKHEHPPSHALFVPAENIEIWQSWFTVASLSSPQTEQQSAVFLSSVTSVRKLKWDQTSQDVMSALICMEIIPCRCTGSEIYSATVIQG